MPRWRGVKGNDPRAPTPGSPRVGCRREEECRRPFRALRTPAGLSHRSRGSLLFVIRGIELVDGDSSLARQRDASQNLADQQVSFSSGKALSDDFVIDQEPK